ncbi:MAG: 3-phosphoshikimate 1-carboxyvinyltransferase [Prevotellaceae bacterium]|jgi:3-phosphoshikimate 1-carboxyvinyltransferase|nr:3-phosphoshikimate 1-carboxyvinyltransferase [Prevotellaceae bacterium]
MTKSVKYTTANGRVAAPASKSVAQRAVVAALLARGTSVLRNLTLCSDTQAALGVAQALGAQVRQQEGSLLITSNFFANSAERLSLFCGESGLLTRMITPVAALLPQPVEVSGHGSLATRPIGMVEAPLRDLGATVATTGGLLPLRVQGRLRGGTASIDGSLSSQLLTGLLMALPLALHPSTLHVHSLKSRPYVDLTVALLKAFGVSVAHDERYEVFRIGGQQRYAPCSYSVEGDWSGASCLLVAGAIAGRVTVENLSLASPQADREMLTALKRAGAQVCIEACGGNGNGSSDGGSSNGNGGDVRSAVTVSQSPLSAFTFDATDCPDLFPALAVLASCCDGVSVVKGASRLTHKESNRALALQKEFGALGVAIALRGDEMLITGGSITGGSVHSHGDHRMAMALATAALRASGEVTIEQAESVEKSYPGFWRDLDRLGEGSAR